MHTKLYVYKRIEAVLDEEDRTHMLMLASPPPHPYGRALGGGAALPGGGCRAIEWHSACCQHKHERLHVVLVKSLIHCSLISGS